MNISSVSAFNYTDKTSKLSCKPKPSNLQRYNNTLSKDTFSFGSLTAEQIENKLLEEDNIVAEFVDNQLVADAVLTTVNTFKHLFGKDYLPSRVRYLNFGIFYPEDVNALGTFVPDANIVAFNSAWTNFANFNTLKKRERMGWNPMPMGANAFSTTHPLRVFFHEFAHCAHYANMCKNGNGQNWNWMYETDLKKIPHFKLARMHGQYATTNLAEYMAETIAQQILKEQPRCYPNHSLNYDNIDLLLINSNHQDFIDTYSIWNGDKNNIVKNLHDILGDEK